MNIRTKTFTKILTNRIQQYIKINIYHDQVWFISGMQVWFNIQKPTNIIHHMESLKEKNNRSVDRDQEFDKIQHLFITKTLNKLGIEREIPWFDTEYLQRITANTVFNREWMNAFSPKIRSKERFLLLPLLYNTVLEGLIIVIRQENEIKAYWSERKKTCYLQKTWLPT